MIKAIVFDGGMVNAELEVSDLAKEGGIGVVVSVRTGEAVTNIQLGLLDAAELIAAMVHAVRAQHEAAGLGYENP